MKKQLSAVGRGLRALPRVRLRLYVKRVVDPNSPLNALDDAQLAEAIIRQAADATARLAILLGEQDPPRGFNAGQIKGPKRKLVAAARESLGSVMEGLREAYARASS